MIYHYYTLKDSDGHFYLDEFREMTKSNINDDLVLSANMDWISLDEMLANGFKIVMVRVMEVAG